MQNAQESEIETIVACTGNRRASRDNSLFSFFCDYRHDFNCRSTLSNNPDRQAVYCEIDYPEEEASEEVFPGAHLCLEHARHRPHLTIDKKLLGAEHFLAKLYTPAHAVLTYETQQERFVAHIYFNRNGNTTHLTVKAFTLSHELIGNIEVSPHQASMIFQQVKPLQSVLEEIIRKKSEIYIARHRDFFDHNQMLIEAKFAGDAIKVQHEANYLKTLFTKLDAYSDEFKLSKHFLQNIESRLQEEVPLISPSSAESPTVQPPAIMTKKLAQKTKKKQQKKQQILVREHEIVDLKKQQIEELVQNMSALRAQESFELTEEYLDLWQNLDYSLLELELSRADNIAVYIQAQYERLPIQMSLIDYFKASVLQGLVAQVQQIWTFVEHGDLYPVFKELFRMLVNDQKKALCRRELLSLIEFFYEQSECFRHLAQIQTRGLWAINNKTHGGYLFQFYLNDNLPAFKTFINLTDCINSSQLLLSEDQTLNILHAIVLFYQQNPNRRFIEYLLVEKGMSLDYTQPKSTCFKAWTNDPAVLDAQLKSFLHKKAHQSKSNTLLTTHNALTFALTVTPNLAFPSLVSLLIKHADLKAYFAALGLLVSNRSVISRMLYRCSIPALVFCSEPEEFDDLSHRIASVPGDRFSLLYRISSESLAEADEATQNQLKKRIIYASDIANAIHKRVNKPDFDHTILRDLLHYFTRVTQLGKGEACFAAQLCYLFIPEPQSCDHQNLFDSYVALIDCQKQISSHDHKAYSDKAFHFVACLNPIEAEAIKASEPYRRLSQDYRQRRTIAQGVALHPNSHFRQLNQSPPFQNNNSLAPQQTLGSDERAGLTKTR